MLFKIYKGGVKSALILERTNMSLNDETFEVLRGLDTNYTVYSNWKQNLDVKELAEMIILGPQQEVLEDIDRFNNMYWQDVKITKAFRLRPGTHLKYKNGLNNYMGHNKKATSLSSYHQRLEDRLYGLGRMKDKIRQIEFKLYDLRSRNMVFQDNTNNAEEIVEMIHNAIEESAIQYNCRWLIKDPEYDWQDVGYTNLVCYWPLTDDANKYIKICNDGTTLMSYEKTYNVVLKIEVNLRILINFLLQKEMALILEHTH